MLKIANKSDEALLNRLKVGDDIAFGELVDANWGKIYNRAYKLLSNKEDAEEVAQDTFIRAKKSIENFRGECSLSTWLYHIATNLAHNKHWYWWRRKRAFSVSLDTTITEDGTLTIEDVLPSDAASPAEDCSSTEFMDILPLAINSLPAKYSQVIKMRNEEDLSYEEIAVRLRISVGTVKSRLSRAREYLRAEIEKFR